MLVLVFWGHYVTQNFLLLLLQLFLIDLVCSVTYFVDLRLWTCGL